MQLPQAKKRVAVFRKLGPGRVPSPFDTITLECGHMFLRLHEADPEKHPPRFFCKKCRPASQGVR